MNVLTMNYERFNYEQQLWQATRAKIMNFSDIANAVSAWKIEEKTVVFTNGCFDILHYGHLHYLTAARELGDILVVGVNSRSSVERLKGKNRPINDDETRFHLLAALACVDAVVEFEEDTPLNLIQNVLPDILVKGGDYTIDQIVGADLVLNNGGRVQTLDFVSGYSTTNIVEKIKNQQHD